MLQNSFVEQCFSLISEHAVQMVKKSYVFDNLPHRQTQYVLRRNFDVHFYCYSNKVLIKLFKLYNLFTIKTKATTVLETKYKSTKKYEDYLHSSSGVLCP